MPPKRKNNKSSKKDSKESAKKADKAVPKQAASSKTATAVADKPGKASAKAGLKDGDAVLSQAEMEKRFDEGENYIPVSLVDTDVYHVLHPDNAATVLGLVRRTVDKYINNGKLFYTLEDGNRRVLLDKKEHPLPDIVSHDEVVASQYGDVISGVVVDGQPAPAYNGQPQQQAQHQPSGFGADRGQWSPDPAPVPGAQGDSINSQELVAFMRETVKRIEALSEIKGKYLLLQDKSSADEKSIDALRNRVFELETMLHSQDQVINDQKRIIDSLERQLRAEKGRIRLFPARRAETT